MDALQAAVRSRMPIPDQVGIGLRGPHHDFVINNPGCARWLEVHPENYMSYGVMRNDLDVIARDFPLSFHSVGLSLGSVDQPDPHHLDALRELTSRFQPGFVSDHLSWSRVGGVHIPDLLPLPYSAEALSVVARNVDIVQSALRRQILIENPSQYVSLMPAQMSEAEFLGELVKVTGCGVLLDINNIQVSAVNSGIEPVSRLYDFLNHLPPACICEMHLAGHTSTELENGRVLLLDDHGSRVCDEVWELFDVTVAILGPRPTLIEWDTHIPAFDVLQDEAGTAQRVIDQFVSGRHDVAC
jgi:uncharacterized protein